MKDGNRGKGLVSARLKSLRDAGRGLAGLIAGEPNARIHAAATALAIATGGLLGISAEDWRWLVLAIGWVWFAEAVNTAIEHLGDAVTREMHPGIGIAKDVAAGAVLVSAVSAAIIGLMVFLPYLA